MSINLIELAQEYFSDTVIEKISSSLGFDKDTAGNAIGKIFPSLMGLFGEKAQTPEGATQLFDTIKDADTGILDNLGDAFSGDNTDLIDKGQGILTSLLGGKLDSLTDLIGKIPGLGGKAGGLMGLLTPILTGMLGKQVKTNGLNAAGLTSLLDDQKGHISEYLGGDFTGKLGLGSFFSGASAAVAGAAGAAKDAAGDAVDAVGDAVSGAAGAAKDVAGDAVGAVGGAVSGAAAAGVATAEKAGGGLMKFLPIAGVGLLAFVGFKMCSGDDGKSGLDKLKNTADSAASAVSGAVSETGDALSGAASSAGDALSDAGSAVSDTVGGAVDSAGEALSSAGSAVSDTVGGAVDSAGDALSDAGSAVSDTVGGAVDSAGNALSDAGSAVADTVSGAANGIVEGAGDAIPSSGGPIAIELPSFVPTPDAEALSEKATALAQKLTRIQIPEGANIDTIYEKLNTGSDSNFLYRITFATGETGVPEAHRKALTEKLQSVDPTATLVTIGYADTRGDDAENKKLSYGRAKEVGEWIKTVSKDSNLESFSMGETDRFSRTEFSKNRVVEVWQIK